MRAAADFARCRATLDRIGTAAEAGEVDMDEELARRDGPDRLMGECEISRRQTRRGLAVLRGLCAERG
ncbi:hypothetical protein ACI2L1_35815 [Streptomyces sp. NPDC019531]|uniref:hypothetical protein n=1 Tax=Streptomyces sp. NPDC019531 TaxID=3365062 RepID=UPI00384EF725